MNSHTYKKLTCLFLVFIVTILDISAQSVGVVAVRSGRCTGGCFGSAWLIMNHVVMDFDKKYAYNEGRFKNCKGGLKSLSGGYSIHSFTTCRW